MGRLFWKIFFWFCFAQLLLNLGVGWSMKVYYSQLQESDNRIMEARLNALAEAFQNDDTVLVKALVAKSRSDDEPSLFILDGRGRDLLKRPLPHFVKKALRDRDDENSRFRVRKITTPDGKTLKLVALPSPSWHDSFRDTPIWIIFSIGLVIITLVCYGLARYLSAPVQRLSSATRQLAGGDLDVRIGRVKRKDEIADLAMDFDHMADKLQALLNAQKQLLQDISHELRSPLARLQVALALAQRKDNVEAGDYDRIAKDLNRLEELIGEVLTLSRLDTITYDRETVVLDQLITGIVDDCQLEAEAKSCTLQCHCRGELRIEGSPELLRRAVENIVRNAIKFTHPDTLVTVDASTAAGEVIISVQDEGPGIPDESTDTMFDAFVRIDAARPHKPGGYGLGLAIAKKAIELHGGTIVASNNPDKGLTVTIRLPA